MSRSIWTQCAGASEIGPLDVTPWRAVEAQHLISTRKLVDSLDEQAVLEQLIDTAKPPAHVAPSRMHVLLSTPFRYPPLAHGSRFGTRQQPGIWYGSESARAMFAEVADHRLLFLEGTHAAMSPLSSWHTAFMAPARSDRGIDLTLSPFAAHRAAIASPTSYDRTQELGTEMRADGVDIVRYPSARDPDGVNVAVLSPRAFAGSRPRGFETWHCTATRDRVEFARRDFFEARAFTFDRPGFLVDGRLPAPAL